MLWRIMEIEEGAEADNTLRDLHNNSSYDMKAEFNNLLFYTPNANMADLSSGPGLVARKRG